MINEFYKQFENMEGEKAVGWLKPGSQLRHFLTLTQIMDSGPCTVLDAGSGLSDLHGFFNKLNQSVDYTGWDVNPDFIAIARKRYPKIKLELKDFMKTNKKDAFDYVISSGGLAVLSQPSDAWEGVKKLYGLARKGVAANFVSAYGWADTSDMLTRVQPEIILTQSILLAKEKKIALIHEGDEFSLLISKEGS
jgi:SAM-dependent methyltransferase|tara:strand:+ start:186 stop:764 length:579 start_codon:yes stop_codon:yes gene_type:complete